MASSSWKRNTQGTDKLWGRYSLGSDLSDNNNDGKDFVEILAIIVKHNYMEMKKGEEIQEVEQKLPTVKME